MRKLFTSLAFPTGSYRFPCMNTSKGTLKQEFRLHQLCMHSKNVFSLSCKLNFIFMEKTWPIDLRGISKATVSRTFNHVLHVMCLPQTLDHVGRERWFHENNANGLSKTLSKLCGVIIDCFKIFLERATHPLARAQTHHTNINQVPFEVFKCYTSQFVLILL